MQNNKDGGIEESGFGFDRDGGMVYPGKRTEKVLTTQGHHDFVEVTYSGLSLRDHFAGTALPQVIANHLAIRATMIKPGDFNFSEMARTAYMVADAMLRERAK